PAHAPRPWWDEARARARRRRRGGRRETLLTPLGRGESPPEPGFARREVHRARGNLGGGARTRRLRYRTTDRDRSQGGGTWGNQGFLRVLATVRSHRLGVEPVVRDFLRRLVLVLRLRLLGLPSPQGPCPVCGEWIDADTEDVYGVVVSRDGRGRASLAAHARCLTSVTHPSVSLPG